MLVPAVCLVALLAPGPEPFRKQAKTKMQKYLKSFQFQAASANQLIKTTELSCLTWDEHFWGKHSIDKSFALKNSSKRDFLFRQSLHSMRGGERKKNRPGTGQQVLTYCKDKQITRNDTLNIVNADMGHKVTSSSPS